VLLLDRNIDTEWRPTNPVSVQDRPGALARTLTVGRDADFGIEPSPQLCALTVDTLSVPLTRELHCGKRYHSLAPKGRVAELEASHTQALHP